MLLNASATGFAKGETKGERVKNTQIRVKKSLIGKVSSLINLKILNMFIENQFLSFMPYRYCHLPNPKSALI